MPGLASFLNTIDIDAIPIHRDERQRVVVDDLEGLKTSIRRRGLLNPIIVSRTDKRLIAGERRLTSFKQLRDEWATEQSAAGTPPESAAVNPFQRIPFRYFDELSETEAQEIELIENLHRKELPWRDMAVSVYRIHQLRLTENPKQTQADTAKELGMSESAVSVNLSVGEAITEGKVDLSNCNGVQAAQNILKRVADREQAALVDELNFLAAKSTKVPAPVPVQPKEISLLDVMEGKPLSNGTSETGRHEPKASLTENSPKTEDTASRTIIQADFFDWAASYSDQPFNLLHCDFPYGINFGASRRQNSASDRIAYDDSPDLFWRLCECLGDNFDRIVADSAHFVFWFSLALEPEHPISSYERIRIFFKKLGLTINPFPLNWNRNNSILPDPNRGPRRGYETAFFMTRGDRKIIRPVQNFYEDSSRSEKNIHHSEKPLGMLEHYFSMLVDENSRVLDPTCGSGSAIRVARKFKPAAILGIEKDPEFVKYAQDKLRSDILNDDLLGELNV